MDIKVNKGIVEEFKSYSGRRRKNPSIESY